MFVRARIDKGLRRRPFSVPSVSIVRNSKGEATVMVVNRASTVESRIIQAGQNIGDRVLVSEGLQAGEQVIVSGLQKIRVGVPVKVIEQPTSLSSQTAVNQTAAKTE
jgi:membrane fusion protein (multidrug efflux system)